MTSPTAARMSLFPVIEPYRTAMLPVSRLHSIYVEESGNPAGKPVIMIHGGPGGGSNPTMRRFHDPATHRIVVFDQRGCGRSVPNAELDGNTTWDLVADMEKIRDHLGIERWQLFGGSWGSTLALAYAQTHPERVSDMVLRGIFTLRRAELEWFYQAGAHWIFPESFEPYQAMIPADERHDMIGAYYRRLTGDDQDARLAAAKAWSMWEASALSLYPDPLRVSHFGADAYALAFARIECHYFVNRGFFDHDDQLLRNVSRIRHIRATIVHGRYDICTPVRIGWELSKAWPEADFRVVADAGHAMTEPGISSELVATAARHFGPQDTGVA